LSPSAESSACSGSAFLHCEATQLMMDRWSYFQRRLYSRYSFRFLAQAVSFNAVLYFTTDV
jgi:hypothetical protein